MKSHDIKNKLEARRMEISENSWEKLASQLDANDQTKKRKGFYYLPYAACLALLFSFIAHVMLTDAGNTTEEKVVETNTKENVQQKQNTTPTIIRNALNDEIFKEAIVQSESVKELKKIEVSQEVSTEKSSQEELKNELKKEIESAVVVHKIDTLSKELNPVIPQKDVAMNITNELKASIMALSASENIAITDEEINQLLKEAQTSFSELEIKEEKTDVLRFATASELLDEVEYELDMSFKEKVFKLIKNKVQEKQTFLADN